MPDLRTEPVATDATLKDWVHVHNLIVPPAAMTVDEARGNVTRRRLEVAYFQDVLVACTTVRPPEEDSPDAATVIVRVLPEFRRRGFGAELYARALTHAKELGATHVETIVWAPNAEGLKFAHANGFAEVDRYLPPGETHPFLTLRLTADS